MLSSTFDAGLVERGKKKSHWKFRRVQSYRECLRMTCTCSSQNDKDGISEELVEIWAAALVFGVVIEWQ